LVGLAEKMANPSITVTQMQGLSKYIVYHGDLLRAALKDLSLTGRSSFLKGDFYQQIQRIEDRQPEDTREKHLQELSYFLSTLGIPDDTLLVEEPEPVEETTESFFALEAQLEAEPVAEPITASVPEEPVQEAFPESEEIIQTPVETQPIELWPIAEPDQAAVPEDTFVPEPEPVIAPPVFAPPATQFVADPDAPIAAKTTFDLAEADKEESLGDRLARQQQGQGLYAKVAAASTENLHSIIAIGERYMIVGALFGGDMASYSLAISRLNTMTSYQDAVHYLWDEVGTNNSWNPESDSYKTLDAALRRKFAA
jgi:hypothetical protein